jgi:hypothetical protein
MAKDWFSVGLAFGASKEESHTGAYVGELRYSIDPKVNAPYRFAFERVKPTLVTGEPEKIELDINTLGKPFRIRFKLLDADRKAYETDNIEADTKGWKHYSLDLSDLSKSNLTAPISLKRIIFETDDTTGGRIFVDNLSFVGRFSAAALIDIRPVYKGISYSPDAVTVRKYRFENATDMAFDGTLVAGLHDAKGQLLTTIQKHVSLLPSEFTYVSVDYGQLPIGAYQADLHFADKSERYQAVYDDTFAVFIPNNGRVNQHPMWMGVLDLTIWETKAERDLHMEWMIALGSDANRISGGATRLEPQDDLWATENWHEALDPFEAADIQLLFTFFELPNWITRNPARRRTPPRDMKQFAQHSREFAEFTKAFPAIKWVQFWNEPDSGGPNVNHGFFHGTRDDYLTMFQTFSESFRSVRDDVTLTTGGLTLKDEIAGVSQASIVDHADDYDVVAFHAHGALSNYERKQKIVESWLDEAGLKKPILNSETGERSGYTRSGRYQQAISLIQKVVYAKSRPNSELYMWFTLQDYWDMDAEADDSFGLITSDNCVKPSFVAYNELIRQLANTTPKLETQWGENVRVFPFRRTDGRLVYVCWLENGSAAEHVWLKVPQGSSVTATDMFGRSETLPQLSDAAFLAISSGPVYLTTEQADDAALLSKYDDTHDDLLFSLPASIVIDGDSEQMLPFSFNGSKAKDCSSVSIQVLDSDGQLSLEKSFPLVKGGVLKAAFPVSGNLLTQADYPWIQVKIIWGKDSSLTVPILLNKAYPIQFVDHISERFSDHASAQTPNIEALPKLVLNRPDDVVEFAFDPSIRPWRGPQDLSAVARLAHDAHGVYVCVDVTDDLHVQTSYSSRLERGDSVSLSIGTSESGMTELLMGLSDKGWKALWLKSAKDPQQVGRWDLPLRVKRSGTMTRYEAYLPFDMLDIKMTPGVQAPIRFSFMVNEDDGQRPDRWQRRVRYLRWYEVGTNIDRAGHAILK